jgi:prepilin-type N-terminal cleavage/methylation domain-containing protein
MKNNQGFTLIELIIVIIIVGVLSAGTVLGADILGFGSARSTVNRINTMLDEVQIENMTKNKSYYLIVYQQNGDYYLRVEAGTQVISREKLELKRGEITYRESDSSTTYLVSETAVEGRDTMSKVEVSFQKDTGGIKENRGNEIITQIGVSSAGSSYTIYLVEATGKHYIE